MLGNWQREITGLIAKVRANGEAANLERLDLLERAGPLHNPEATKIILSALLSKDQSASAVTPASAATPSTSKD